METLVSRASTIRAADASRSPHGNVTIPRQLASRAHLIEPKPAPPIPRGRLARSVRWVPDDHPLGRIIAGSSSRSAAARLSRTPSSSIWRKERESTKQRRQEAPQPAPSPAKAVASRASAKLKALEGER